MLVLSMVVSHCLLGVLVGLLVGFNGRPIFDSRAVTLNTLVAVLSAANKATIMYAVSFAVGQWKWIAFSERRRLLDVERIESASRGLLGSPNLLFNTGVKRLSLARLGALLAVLAVALDPSLSSWCSTASRMSPTSETPVARPPSRARRAMHLNQAAQADG